MGRMTLGAGKVVCLRDQRGVALVMAILALLILSVLVIGFSVLASTEPTIASNQLRVAQARALAESGLERAVWALSAGKAGVATSSGAIAYQLAAATAPAPYNGSQLLSLSTGGNSLGGFRLTVAQTNTTDPHQVAVQSVGWVPTDDGADTHTKAHQKVTAIVMDFPNLSKMPCAVCVRGDIQVGGTSTVDSRSDTTCGTRYGTWSTTVCPAGSSSQAGTGTCRDSNGNVVTPISPGNTVLGSGLPKVYGSKDGNNTANQTTDTAKFQSQADFDKNALTNSSLDLLRSYAKSQGTYYQGTKAAPTITFSSTNKLPDCPPNG